MKKELKLILATASLSVVALSAATAEVFAADPCDKATSSWEGAGLDFTCYFEGFGGPSAEASSYSRTDPASPHKHQLIADLMTNSGNAGYTVWAYAQGYDGNGQPIARCRTQDDKSTAQGATVGNGSDCESAVTHHLVIKRQVNPPR